MADKKSNFSREEDYRDYEARDVDEGWPYSDEPGASAPGVGNDAYGEAGADFDRERNEGFRVSNTEKDGFQHKVHDPVLPETNHRERSDQIESDINSALELLDIDLMGVDLHVDGHIVILRGAVDTPEERRRIELATLAVDGVEDVDNRINTRGVDTHIPSDVD